jgi:hypothetical protein
MTSILKNNGNITLIFTLKQSIMQYKAITLTLNTKERDLTRPFLASLAVNDF